MLSVENNFNKNGLPHVYIALFRCLWVPGGGLEPFRGVFLDGESRRRESKGTYYPTALRRVQITPKTSTNITRYLYSRGPVRQVSCR